MYSVCKGAVRIMQCLFIFDMKLAYEYFLMYLSVFTESECWLVGCFGFNGPFRQYFSLYRAVSQKEGERGERIDESKNVQTAPTRTCCKRNRPLPYCNQKCRTPRHWKVTQHHRTTRPPPSLNVFYLMMCANK